MSALLAVNWEWELRGSLIVIIAVLVIKLLPGARGPARPSALARPSDESPDRALDRMFALGEIDEATYRARRAALNDMRRPS